MAHFSNDVLWNDRPWRAFESLQHDVACDVCVIGLGASGLSAIQHLVAAGRRVVGIDTHMVGHGAAGSNGGFILAGIAAFHHDAVAQLGNTLATALYQQTIAEISHLADTEPGFRQTGSLRIACDADEYADCLAQYRVMRADGLPVERYTGPEGEGLLFPGDGGFQPLARVRRLAQAAHTAGAQLYERSMMTAIRTGEVQVGHHRILAKHILVAVDGGLERIFPQLSNEIRTTRLQMIGTAPDLQCAVSRPVYYRYGYDYWQQLPDGRIVIGGSRDRHADAEWGYATGPSPAVQHDIEATLRTVVRSRAPITHRWGASVAYRISDVRPIVREVLPQVWACGAYNGTGNLVGTIVTRLVAETIMHGHVPTALTPWIKA